MLIIFACIEGNNIINDSPLIIFNTRIGLVNTTGLKYTGLGLSLSFNGYFPSYRINNNLFMTNNRPLLSFNYCSPPLKTQPDLDQVRSTTTQRTNPFSLSSPLSLKTTIQRVNQIKPKPKIKLPQHRPTITSPSTLKTEGQARREEQAVKMEGEQLGRGGSKKGGLLGWMKLEFMCGMGGSSKGKESSQGCTCPPPCPVREEWLCSQQESDMSTYSKLKKEKPTKQCKAQIQKDINRTYPTTLAFTNPVFQGRLSEVLTVYSIYDMQLGYVQGLNTIAAILLFHIKDTQPTFWALVDLMQCHQLRLNYLPSLTQLQHHCSSLQQHIHTSYPQLRTHTTSLGIDIKIILHGWLLTMMSKMIPLQEMHRVLGMFRRYGWGFMYQLVLSVVRVFKQGMMLAQDEADFVMAIGDEACRQLALQWKDIIESARPKSANIKK